MAIGLIEKITLGLLIFPILCVQAEQLSGVVDVSLRVRSGCLVGGFASTADVGRLRFGEHGPSWIHALTADGLTTSDGGQLRVACSPDIDGFLVSIDGGHNGTQASRYVAMRDATGRVVARVPYNVYRDPTHRLPYVPLIPQSFRIDGAHTEVLLPLFGVIPGQAQALPAGIYQDLLGITLDW